MSVISDWNDLHPLNLTLAGSPEDDGLPIVIFTDDADSMKVTKCIAPTNEPITVIMHDYGKSSLLKNCQSTKPSLSFHVCKLFDRLTIDLTCLSGITRESSSTTSEIMSRTNDLKSAVKNENERCYCATNLRCKIWVIQNVVNFLLGILFMAFLLVYGHVVSSQLLYYMQSGVNSMILLLDWLMGVPAGLKLNYNLTAFVGRFFMYHIWLWAEYLKIAGKHFNIMFICVFAVGLTGGASLQIALLQDTFKILLLHIYCFHIYTSRLYSLMRYSLVSLWRLFRGLKWNPLRKRVDHASYDSTQLFIGTLIFAILLFILPTAFLYYLVFAFLRAVIVALHIVFDQFRYLLVRSYTLMYEPLIGFMYNLFDKEDYGLSVQSSSGDNITVLTMRHKYSLMCANCKL